MIDFKSFLVFAHVAETLSFSETARRSAVPVSTVSRRIAKLEEQLGLGVLQRSTRSLRLTPIGHEALHLARRTAEVAEVVEDIVPIMRPRGLR